LADNRRSDAGAIFHAGIKHQNSPTGCAESSQPKTINALRATPLARVDRVLNGHCLDVKFAEHATNFGWSFNPTASIRSTIAIPDHAGR
jgi:hypothetical protein